MKLLLHDKIISEIYDNDIIFLETIFDEVIEPEKSPDLLKEERVANTLKKIQGIYETVVAEHIESKTSLLWIQYLKMVDVLMSYVRFIYN
jgi:hypothetical protein